VITSMDVKRSASADDLAKTIAGKKPGDVVVIDAADEQHRGLGVIELPLDKWSADPHAQSSAGMLMAIGAILACLIAPLAGAILGRRPTYFLMCLVSLVVVGYVFRAFDRYGPMLMFLIFLCGAVSAAFSGWLPLYLPELFPTRIRATAQGITYNFGRILAAGGALISGSLVKLWGGYAGMGAALSLIYIVGMIVIWFAPETKGKPLPE